MSMFCAQCQEAARNTGCTVRGVCGKSESTSSLQDVLVYACRGLALAVDMLHRAVEQAGQSREGQSQADPDDTQTRPEPIWIQFERPGPYKIEVAGTFDRSKPNAGLEFYPLEDTSLSPLPRSLWIEEHDGKYAIAD